MIVFANTAVILNRKGAVDRYQQSDSAAAVVDCNLFLSGDDCVRLNKTNSQRVNTRKYLAGLGFDEWNQIAV